MARIASALVFACVLAVGPALAATTPEGLVRELNSAAHAGDETAYLAALSANTRRAIAAARAASARVDLAERNFYAVLEERFGASPGGGGTPVHRTGLPGLVDITLVGVERHTPRGALLRLRTVTNGVRGHTVTREYVFPAVVENGDWKLDLSAAELGILRTYQRWEAAYQRVTQQVRAGAFRNQAAAAVALAKARRGPG